MFCPNCGKNVKDGDAFCESCGSALSAADALIKKTPSAESGKPVSGSPDVASGKNSDKSFTVLAIIITVLLVVLIVLLSFSFLSEKSNNKPIDTPQTPVSPTIDTSIPTDIPEIVVSEEPPLNSFSNTINAFLSENGVANDVAVAVIDNTTGLSYESTWANVSYESWGFYLPVYMAFCDMYPQSYASYKADIMSSDAGKCNAAANFAINTFGGAEYISEYIYAMGYPSTSYGRKFGEANSKNGNYTTAAEAASILYRFYMTDNPGKLCYNPKNFGVSVPQSGNGTTMYAQFGTENAAKKKNFNIFAIIQGPYSDYCVAIMTKNGASANGLTNDLLNLIHQIMEG